MLSRTIGPGGDYAGFSALATALNGTTLSQDNTYTIIGNVADNAVNAIFTSIDLGGHILKFTSSVPHKGDPTASWVVDNSVLSFASCVNGLMDFEDVYLRGENGQALIINGCTMSLSICQSLFRSNNFGPPAVTLTGGTLVAGASNSKFWGKGSGAFSVDGAASLFKVENCVAAQLGGTGFNGSFIFSTALAGSYCRNSYGITDHPASSRGFAGAAFDSDVEQDHNAASTGNVAVPVLYPNLANASNLLSVSDTNPNFLNTDPVSALYTAGIAALLACNPFTSSTPIGYIPPPAPPTVPAYGMFIPVTVPGLS